MKWGLIRSRTSWMHGYWPPPFPNTADCLFGRWESFCLGTWMTSSSQKIHLAKGPDQIGPESSGSIWSIKGFGGMPSARQKEHRRVDLMIRQEKYLFKYDCDCWKITSVHNLLHSDAEKAVPVLYQEGFDFLLQNIIFNYSGIGSLERMAREIEEFMATPSLAVDHRPSSLTIHTSSYAVHMPSSFLEWWLPYSPSPVILWRGSEHTCRLLFLTELSYLTRTTLELWYYLLWVGLDGISSWWFGNNIVIR